MQGAVALIKKCLPKLPHESVPLKTTSKASLSDSGVMDDSSLDNIFQDEYALMKWKLCIYQEKKQARLLQQEKEACEKVRMQATLDFAKEMGMELTKEEMKEVMDIDCDTEPLAVAKEATDSVNENDNAKFETGTNASVTVPSHTQAMSDDDKDGKVDIGHDGNDNMIKRENRDPLNIPLNPNVLKNLDNAEMDDNLEKGNDSDKIVDSPKSSNAVFEPDMDVFKSPVSKRHKISTFEEISHDFSSPKSKPSVPRTPKGRRSGQAMSNVSKTLDFSQVSPQAVATTHYNQSADYLKKLSHVKQQIIAKGNQFIKLNKSQKYVEQVSKTLNELGLVTFKPWGENVSPEEVKLNTFFKIFSENGDKLQEEGEPLDIQL